MNCTGITQHLLQQAGGSPEAPRKAWAWLSRAGLDWCHGKAGDQHFCGTGFNANGQGLTASGRAEMGPTAKRADGEALHIPPQSKSRVFIQIEQRVPVGSEGNASEDDHSTGKVLSNQGGRSQNLFILEYQVHRNISHKYLLVYKGDLTKSGIREEIGRSKSNYSYNSQWQDSWLIQFIIGVEVT